MSERTFKKSKLFLDWEAAALLAAEAAYGAADGSLPHETFLKYKAEADEAYSRYRKVEYARSLYETASAKAAEAWHAASGLMTPTENRAAWRAFLEAEEVSDKAYADWKAIEKEML